MRILLKLAMISIFLLFFYCKHISSNSTTKDTSLREASRTTNLTEIAIKNCENGFTSQIIGLFPVQKVPSLKEISSQFEKEPFASLEYLDGLQNTTISVNPNGFQGSARIELCVNSEDKVYVNRLIFQKENWFFIFEQEDLITKNENALLFFEPSSSFYLRTKTTHYDKFIEIRSIAIEGKPGLTIAGSLIKNEKLYLARESILIGIAEPKNPFAVEDYCDDGSLKVSSQIAFNGINLAYKYCRCNGTAGTFCYQIKNIAVTDSQAPDQYKNQTFSLDEKNRIIEENLENLAKDIETGKYGDRFFTYIIGHHNGCDELLINFAHVKYGLTLGAGGMAPPLCNYSDIPGTPTTTNSNLFYQVKYGDGPWSEAIDTKKNFRGLVGNINIDD